MPYNFVPGSFHTGVTVEALRVKIARKSACDGRTDGQTDRRTDERTDRILITIPRLHYMQRGKNLENWHMKPVKPISLMLVPTQTKPRRGTLHAGATV